jgi:hypothetical protein
VLSPLEIEALIFLNMLLVDLSNCDSDLSIHDESLHAGAEFARLQSAGIDNF